LRRSNWPWSTRQTGSQRKSPGPGRTPSQGPHPSMPLRNPENKLRPTSATRCCTCACQVSQNAAALRHLSQGCTRLCGIPSRWAFRTNRPHGLSVVRCLHAVSQGSKAFLSTGLRCHEGSCPLCRFPFKALRHTGIRAGCPVNSPLLPLAEAAASGGYSSCGAAFPKERVPSWLFAPQRFPLN